MLQEPNDNAAGLAGSEHVNIWQSLLNSDSFSKRCPFCLPFTIRNPQMGANLKIFKQSRK